MKQIQNIIEIVFDPKKKKLRARSIQDGRWCKFPNKLRKEKAIYLASKMTAGIGDSWNAGGEITPFVITHEKNLVLEEMLNIKNKALLRQFYEVLVNDTTKKVNTEMLNIIFLVKKIFPQIDEQLLLPLIKTYSHSAFVSSDLLLPLQNMLNSYNEKRVVGLFSNYQEDDFLEDTVEMYGRLFENDIEINEVLPKQPKNIRELHTIFWRELAKVKVPKKTLKQELPHLDQKNIGDFKVFVPQTTHDLINIGNTLSICVGNGYYAEKILRSQCNIIALVDKGGRYKYCIEFHRGQIIQARGFANENANKELQSLILKALENKESLAS